MMRGEPENVERQQKPYLERKCSNYILRGVRLMASFQNWRAAERHGTSGVHKTQTIHILAKLRNYAIVMLIRASLKIYT